MPPADAPVKPAPRAPAPRRSIHRIQIGLNVIVQIVVFTFIIGMINAYAFKHFKRFDFSRDHKYALSARTKQFLASLNKPVKIIVFMSPQAPLQSDLTNLAQEYAVNQPKFISTEQVDPFRNIGRATEIQAKYKLAQQENVVIVDCDGHQKVIGQEQMADVDSGNEMFGQQPQITAFKGEQAITGAIIEVTEGKKSTVYYLRGQGQPEMTGQSSPMALLAKVIQGEHVSLSELNLLNVESVPADASVVMILGPHYDLSDREAKLLNDYWQKGGRVLVALNPDVQTPHLAAFLDKLGIKPDDDRIIETVNLGPVTGLVRDAAAEFVGTGPITKELAGVSTIFPGATQSLTLEPDRVRGANVKLEPLLQAAKGFWGETEYKDLENTGAYYDKGKDKDPPLYIAASVEKGAVGDQRVQVGAARLIVVSNSRFVDSDALTEANANFFVSSLNWLLEREQLIGIPPKQIKTFSLSLPESQVTTLFSLAVLAIPGFFALLGVLVWWRRRA